MFLARSVFTSCKQVPLKLSICQQQCKSITSSSLSSSSSTVQTNPASINALKSSPSSPASRNSSISWTDYFALRKSRKLWEQAGGGMLGASGLFGSGYYLLSVAEFDPITLVWGFLDPQMAYIGASMLAGAGGSAAGVLLGGTAWGLLQKSSVLKAIDRRDKEFFHRIARNRPQEIKTNVQNPMPDYYGEKIKSVPDYRNWLKKQREWKAKHHAR